MDFQRLQNRQLTRVRKIWKTTRREALVRAREWLEASLEFVQKMESSNSKRPLVRKPKASMKLTPKKSLKSYMKPHKDVIHLHTQTTRHH